MKGKAESRGAWLQIPTVQFSNGLRDALTNIFAVIPLLQRKMDDDSPYLEEIRLNAHRMLRDIIDIEIAGRILNRQVRSECLDFASVVESIRTCASVVCGIDIGGQASSEPAVVIADQDILNHVILGAIRNSIQYARDGSSINMVVTADKRRVTLQIRDSGKGVLPVNQAMLFDPFFSADPYADGHPAPGLGLGLYNLSGYIRLIGGVVAAKSDFGEGTEILISLPALAEAPSEMITQLPIDLLGNRFSPLYIQLCQFCQLPN